MRDSVCVCVLSPVNSLLLRFVVHIRRGDGDSIANCKLFDDIQWALLQPSRRSINAIFNFAQTRTVRTTVRSICISIRSM